MYHCEYQHNENRRLFRPALFIRFFDPYGRGGIRDEDYEWLRPAREFTTRHARLQDVTRGHETLRNATKFYNNSLDTQMSQCDVLHVARCSPMERSVMGTRKQVCKFIRDVVAILVELRVLTAELVFTAAAVYGIYQTFRLLLR